MISQGSSRGSRRAPRLLLALMLGGAAALGVFLYINSVQDQARQDAERARAESMTQTSSVLVAKDNVPAQTPLSPSMFVVKDIPVGLVLPGALTAFDTMQGKVLNTPLAAGEQVLPSRLVDPQSPDVKKFSDLIPQGKRAMAVTFTELSTAGGLIVPGDFVDVMAVFGRDVLGKDQSMILLQDVQVLAVAQNTSIDQLPRSGADANQQQPAPRNPALPAPSPTPVRVPVAPAQTRTVTLAVEPEAAERLALAEAHGNLIYVVRPSSERNQSAVLPADLSTLSSPIQAASAQIIATEISPTNVKVGDTITVQITLKNTSDKPLQTQDPQPGYTYVQGQTYFSQQFASTPGKWRVGIGSAGLDTTELPYRWGFGGDLAPGATTTVSGQIKVTSDFQPTNFWAAVIEEPAKVVQTGVGMTLITAMPQSVAIVAVDAANVRSGPSIASSVLDQVKYGTQLEIIGQSADWFKIRLPDQREGWVAAGWIVTAGR
ncbi:MAG TPA: Flp pilus assembly protein CpaB [Chloroflexota bacterium]